jgi:hypothetical protein
MTKQLVAKLKDLYQEAEVIRGQLQISEPKSMIYLSDVDAVNTKKVIVEANGLGAAVVRVIEGNYPVDFFIHAERQFAREHDAVSFAEELIEKRLPISIAFAPARTKKK